MNFILEKLKDLLALTPTLQTLESSLENRKSSKKLKTEKTVCSLNIRSPVACLSTMADVLVHEFMILPFHIHLLKSSVTINVLIIKNIAVSETLSLPLKNLYYENYVQLTMQLM